MFSSLYVKALEYPRWFLAVTTLIVFALITRGDFSDFDTVGRLQVTHWLWTSEPQVSEGYRYSIPTPPTAINIFSAPGFCALIGKDGQIFAQFGLGQSVIMLPADIFSYFIVKRLSENRNYHSTDSRIADFIVKRLGENRKYRSTDSRIAEDFKFGEIPAEHGFMRNTIVNLTTFPVISAVAIVLAYDLVTILGFTPAISLSASLLLLTSTTFIVYMQDVEENTLMFMCYAGALVFALKTKLRSPRLNAFVSGVFVGFNLLIQLPNIVYLPSILVLLVWISTRKSSQAGGDNARQVIGREALVKVACFLAPIIGFLLIDRYYQYYRFGEWFSTYMKECVETYARVGGYPKGYPFGYNPIWGFFGPFLSPDRSLFLFDPMIVFIVIFAIYNWRSITICRKFVIMSAFSSLIGLSLLYSGSYYWNGGANWGPRHHLIPVELLCLLGFAFCASNFIHYKTFNKVIIVLGIALATVCQAISLPIPAGLEVFQFIDGDPLRVIPAMRIRNLLYLIIGTVPDYNDPDIESFIRSIEMPRSPDLLFFRISHSLSFVPSSAILIAWTLLVTTMVFVISVIVLRGFLFPGKAVDSILQN